MDVTTVILAAGQGTRMRSKTPKFLHPLAGQPLLEYSLRLAEGLGGHQPVIVVGHGADAVRERFGMRAAFALQEQQLGTGHALLAAESMLKARGGLVVVIFADMPLIKAETLKRIVELQASNSGPVSLLTVELPDPHGFGRVVRDENGDVRAIVEEAVATPAQKAIRELNASVYCFKADWLWPALQRIQVSPKGEYYLTDIVEIAVRDGLAVQAYQTPDATEAVGINTRVHLAEASAILRQRINETWMLAGVSIIDPASTYIETDVQIGQDTVIWPNTHLKGQTVIGAECVIGPNTTIDACAVGQRCTVLESVLEKSVVEDDVQMGPYAHLRPNVRVGKGAHIGNFGELKNSTLGEHVKMGHFSYVGDAQIGDYVNISAGVITCNYDGCNKNKTVVEKNAFIGSDTMLVAPVTVGQGAITAAGSVVTRDVAPFTLVMGVPARPFRSLEKLE